jgi:hypothetical protein
VDNIAAVYNLHAGKSDSPEVGEVCRLYHLCLDKQFRSCHLWWLPSRLNVADDPSRGKQPVSGIFRSVKVNDSSVIAALTDLPDSQF